MPRFTVRPLAWREINAQLDYLEEQAGLETAERFLDQLMAALKIYPICREWVCCAVSANPQLAAFVVGR